MLQILLMILKFLGIAVLVILGIILAVLLLVLLVPVRYRGDVAFDGTPKGGVMVSWLLHLVTVRVNYDGSVTALVKVLWFKLFDKTVWPAEETADAVETVAEGLDDSLDVEVKPVADADSVSLQTGTQRQTEQIPTAGSNLESNEATGERVVSDQTVRSDTDMNVGSKPNTDSNTETEPNTFADTQQTPVKEPIAERIFNVIRNLIEKITCTYQQICGKVETGQAKFAQVRAFLADEANKNTIRLVKRQIFKLIKHVLPRKLTGRVKFGFDDPATTGQILMYVSPFYGAYAKSLKLEPVFDEKIMEGELHLKGHIRLGSMIWIVIRVVLDQNFRRLLKLLLAKGKKKEETV